MSEQQLKVFLEKLQGDAAMQEKLKSADDINTVVEIAKAAGFIASSDEFNKDQVEVSEEELEVAPGGIFITMFISMCPRLC